VRILQISSASTFGGGERHFVDLCRGLDSLGHDVFVAIRPTCSWRERLDFLPRDRFLEVSIRNSFGMLSAKKIARFAARNRIDIIHAHLGRDYITAGIAARSVGTAKLVITRHVMFPMKSYHRIALSNVDAAIGVSPAVTERLRMIFRYDRVHTIPNGISFDDLQVSHAAGAEFRRYHAIPDDAVVIANIGELRLQKGQRDLVLAANELAKDHDGLHFIIAGEDHTLDGRFRRELRRLVRVLGLEERFLFLGWLDDIRPLLAATDIFVSPSHSESFGLAILDAMAAGRAVVATETDGAKELLGGLADLAAIRDPLDLAAKIDPLISDGSKRDELGSKLRASAEERFGIEKMINATDRLYRELVK
jgi:glycosyltransferase involved in cell wall biosynthesis